MTMTTSAVPFARLLVPYDGSEPARAALRLAIVLAKDGARITLVNVVDASGIIAQSSTAMVALDPAPLINALERQATALLADANALCLAATIVAGLQTVHDTPVAGILNTAAAQASDLIIMGTHARSGMARTFLGSTTEGVMRSSRIPVLTVRAGGRAQLAPFATAVVAVDDSGPSDAAVAVAARLLRTAHTDVTTCHALDTETLANEAAAYGFADGDLAAEIQDEGCATVRAALARAGLPADTPIDLVQGDPAEAVLAVAKARHATITIAGTHGRRGLRRFVLGSVAERLIRASDIPVLIVPMPASSAASSAQSSHAGPRALRV
jgi:nucleotide-binding universal stress UspA family protein